MRHRWFPVEEDMRRDLRIPRPQISRCRVCGIYRWIHNRTRGRETRYGVPYESSLRYAPACAPKRGPHQYMEDAQ